MVPFCATALVLLPRYNMVAGVVDIMCYIFPLKRISPLIKFFLLLLLYQEPLSEGSHIVGTWNSSDFFKFLFKFGFQRTVQLNQKDSYGYIFGNITANLTSSQYVTLAVLDRGYFLQYYGNRTVSNKDEACARMFSRINSVAFDSKCNKKGGDFLRSVPCPKGGLCLEEDEPWDVIKGHQFTYAIQDLTQPR